MTPRFHNGLVTGISSLTTSAAALSGHRRTTAHSLTIGLAQPLRVEAGHGALLLPVGRTKAGAVVHSPLRIGLTPSGRELDVKVRWVRHMAAGRADP